MRKAILIISIVFFTCENTNSRLTIGTPFDLSYDSRAGYDEACDLPLTVVFYHNGNFIHPGLGNIVYQDQSMNNPFDGGNKWRMTLWGAIKISPVGRIIDFNNCN